MREQDTPSGPRRARGIAKTHRGVTFRSHLEARWAHFFDELGWDYEYEPLELDGYIPDFVLLWERPIVVEVKPELYYTGLTKHQERIEQSGWNDEALIVGASARPKFNRSDIALIAGELIGQLGEREADGGWFWGAGILFSCDTCEQTSLHHDYASYRCRRTGCYDGDHHLSGPESIVTDIIVKDAWQAAANATRWRKSRNGEAA